MNFIWELSKWIEYGNAISENVTCEHYIVGKYFTQLLQKSGASLSILSNLG